MDWKQTITLSLSFILIINHSVEWLRIGPWRVRKDGFKVKSQWDGEFSVALPSFDLVWKTISVLNVRGFHFKTIWNFPLAMFVGWLCMNDVCFTTLNMQFESKMWIACDRICVEKLIIQTFSLSFKATWLI
jgi:hypothetical protein